ncbi:MAG TPA: glycine oxidase ThiO [Ktedonobacteraceae bacterium]|nr:glycine oxidase ThiO [Ktedonobacteraceae bacterium]
MNIPIQQGTEVAIIGGGIIGCALAYFLRKRGVEVMVFEKGAIGAQASGAAAGLLAPLGPLSGPGPFADLLLTGFAQLATLVPELEDATGLQLGYERLGALRTIRHPKRLARLKKRIAAWQPLGLELHWLNGQEARQLEPSLSEEVCAAIYAPQESQINAAQLTNAWYQAAQQLGAQFCCGQEVIAVDHQQERVRGIHLSDHRQVSCQHLVLAAGAWTAQWSEPLHLSLPVSPLKGQLLTIPQPEPPLRHLIFGDAIYLAPRGQQILIGATKEEAGFDDQVTQEGLNWLHSAATRLLPALEHSSIHSSWAGLRPRTPDTRPILGSAPGWENVTIATGHNSVGIILSSITAATIAELITTGQPPAIIAPFAPHRFHASSHPN